MTDINKIVSATRVKNDAITIAAGSSDIFKYSNPDRKDITFPNTTNIQGNTKKTKSIQIQIADSGGEASIGTTVVFNILSSLNGYKIYKLYFTASDSESSIGISLTRTRGISTITLITLTYDPTGPLTYFFGKTFLANDLLINDILTFTITGVGPDNSSGVVANLEVIK